MRRRGFGFGVALIALLCVDTTAGAGTQEPTKSLGTAGGLEYLSAKYKDVVTTAGPEAACDEGDRIYGGGGAITGGVSSNLWSNGPISGLSGWAAEGASIDSETVTAFAICGPDPPPIGFGGISVPPMTNNHTTVLTCPSGNLVSAGVAVEDSLFLDSSRPYDGDDVDSKPDDGWLVRGSNPTNATKTGSIVVFCSDALKLSYPTADAKIDPDGAAAIKAKCPKRSVVVGGGYASDIGKVTATTPWDSKDRKRVPEDGWKVLADNISSSQLDYEATAVCIRR